MRCKIYRNAVLRNTLSSTLTFSGDSASFALRPSMLAELANYRFEVYGYNGSQETLVRSIDSVVCGDAFIITGQSNSVAGMFSGSANANQSPFIRVLGSGNSAGSDSTWRIGQGDGMESSLGNTSQWGLRMARQIVDSQKIAVAIFNGGQGAQPIQFFKRNDGNPTDQTTNYGRLLKRVRGAGLTQNIRAIFWHQGENNAYADASTLSIDGYKSAFQSLMSDWLADFPSIERFYVFQIRNGCSCPVDSTAKIKEALRQLAQAGKICVMSTSAETHHTDNCHYAYATGYKFFGDNIYRLLQRDFYGKARDNINAPNIKFAELTNGGQVFTITMEDVLDSLRWAAGAEADFKFYGASPTVTQGSIVGNKVRLVLSAVGTAVTSLSYVGHQNTPEPMVTNLNGIGALHFYKFPITTPRYRDSVSLAAILRSNNVTLPIDSVSASSVSGRIISLKLAERNITVIPRDIGYMDSLKTIDLTGNRLSSLPREIVRLTPTADLLVGYNSLCTVSDTIKTWINRYSKVANWQTVQLVDSIHFCSGGMVEALMSPDKLIATTFDQEFTVSAGGNGLILRFAKPSGITSVTIMKLNGSVIRKYIGVPEVLRVDLSGVPRSVCILQVIGGSRVVSKKVPVL